MTGNQIAWANLYESRLHNRRTEYLGNREIAERERSNRKNEEIQIFKAKLDAATRINTANISASAQKQTAMINSFYQLQIAKENNATKLQVQEMVNSMTKYSVDVNASIKNKEIEVNKWIAELTDTREKMKIANDTELVHLKKVELDYTNRLKSAQADAERATIDLNAYGKATDRMLAKSNAKKNYWESEAKKADIERSKAQARLYDKQASSILTADQQIEIEKAREAVDKGTALLNSLTNIVSGAIGGGLRGIGSVASASVRSKTKDSSSDTEVVDGVTFEGKPIIKNKGGNNNGK